MAEEVLGKSCDFQAGAAADQEKSKPRPRDCESRRAKHETTSKGHFASKKIARCHSESASTTRTISAEGRARTAELVESPQFLNLDHANLRTGSRAACRNRKSPQFLHLDHANLRRGSRAHPAEIVKKSSVFLTSTESPHRVARGLQKS